MERFVDWFAFNKLVFCVLQFINPGNPYLLRLIMILLFYDRKTCVVEKICKMKQKTRIKFTYFGSS